MTAFDTKTAADLEIERIRLEDTFRQELTKGRIFAQRETLRALFAVKDRLEQLKETGADDQAGKPSEV